MRKPTPRTLLLGRFTVRPAARQVDVEVIAVQGVVLRPKDGGEFLTRSVMHGAQEGSLAIVAAPAALDGDTAPVGEDEAGDIESVGVSVLRQIFAARMVDRAAGI